jgi:dTDP-4-dehydrorhamnose reductase
MKVLVVGASGLVGWNLFSLAKRQGHEVYGTCRAHPQPSLMPLHLEDESAVARRLDEVQPNVVFCCAGWSWVDGCESAPAKARLENSEHPAQMARRAAKMGSHFVYFSTSYVFDGEGGPYDEDAQPRPISVYGHSKLEGERKVLEATGGDAMIVRTMGVYGPEPQQKNFVYQVRKKLGEGKSMQVPSDQWGNVTYAPDLAAMAMQLAALKQQGVWNLAGPDPLVRRSDFAQRIARDYSLPVDLIQPVETALLGQPARRPLNGGLYIEKAVKATSIMPQAWVRIP